MLFSSPGLESSTNTKSCLTSMSFMMETAWTSSPAKRRKMPSKPLPTAELREEDDWTRVKDPKEKKRIQNRVAQRTYRHRMKARLGELQARLDSHEGRTSQNGGSNMIQSNMSSTSSTTSAMVNNMTTPENCNDTMSRPTGMTTTWNANPTPPGRGSSEETSSPLVDTKPTLQIPLLQPSLYDHAVAETDATLFQDAGPFLNSPPHSQPSPQTHGLLSPPAQPGPEPTTKPPEFMLDCLRFQTQLLNRLNSVPQDGSFPTTYGQADSVTSNGMSTAEQASCVAAPYTPTHPDGIEFSFEAPVDVWKTENLAQKQPVQDSSSANTLNFPPMAGHLGPVIDAVTDMGPHPIAPTSTSMASQQTSLDERFERIMEQVEAAGFDSFDALVTTYYSAKFGEVSPLAHEQRLSRNRRLPKVVADVFHATGQWSGWERTGFYEEILRSTESMLINESTGARNTLVSKLAPMIEAQKMMGGQATAESILAMKRTIQDELPNSWALTMALAADQRVSWQHDRSNTALATVLLLNFAGHMPNDQLLGLLGTCL
ncbi:Transcription factor lcsF [Paramyrothecium foliicola]|nr:Transcription factor lcsF [Paramyrothecium foliicola]